MRMSKTKPHYIGRYAPSPTGRLHLGNLRTALLAWLHARLQEGEFLLRFDDLDTPRVMAGSDEQIISDLKLLGLDWDCEVMYQSDCIADYERALQSLAERGLCYECFCSRKDIQQAVSAPHGKTTVYPGTCKSLSLVERQIQVEKKAPAVRLMVESKTMEFADGIAGFQKQNLAQDCGDFVIKRADGLFAYQLAVVLDDIKQGVTDIVRGADLLDSAARQLYLFDLFQAKSPIFWHMPLLQDEEGKRLAKRDGSDSLAEWQAQGKTPQQLIAQFATDLGLLKNAADALSAKELLAELDLQYFEKALVHAAC